MKKDERARTKMKKQMQAMEATGHRNILKTLDSFDTEPDGTLYVVCRDDALQRPCSCCLSLHSRSQNSLTAANYLTTA
jgi:hypothetical protein